VPMRDGAVLLADRHWPSRMADAPVVLVRSPYGRGGMFGAMGAMLAERGFQVVVQSVRGTDGSGGDFDPMRQERDDGADTVEWVRKQPWFTGRLYTFGGSYLGNVQWAMAATVPHEIDGMAMSVTLSNFRDEILGSGGFTQDGTLGWSQTVQILAEPDESKRPSRRSMPKLDEAHAHLPVGSMDEAAFGKPLSWWKDWTSHPDPQDPWWQAIDHSPAVPGYEGPVSSVAGWQDIFLPYQLRDFMARQAAGRETWLTIGPWSHAAPGAMAAGLREAAQMLTALRDGQRPFADRGRVRLYLQEAGKWRDFDQWPPAQAVERRYYLSEERTLKADYPSSGDEIVRFTYDPSDPTPSMHGAQIMSRSKDRDMSSLEERQDTVSFTSEVLPADLDVIGPVSVDLYVRSNRENTDFFVCLCDVDKKGKPKQVSDGYLRLRPGRPEADADGVRRIRLECWPTAYRFRKGHRMRLIVASGAFPRYARNLGTGEPMASATGMVSAEQEILIGAETPGIVHVMTVANA